MTACTLRRGYSEPLGNGLRHDHTVACTTGDATCECPYSFWQPHTTPRHRIKVAGTMQDALDVRLQMQQQHSPIIYMTTGTLTVIPATAPTLMTSDPVPTLSEWAERTFTSTWHAHAPGTTERRRGAYRLYIEPELATLPMTALTPAAIEDWLARLTNRKVSVSQVQYSYDLLRALLGVWAKRHAIPNPMSFVDRPRKPVCDQRRAKDRALTGKQYQHLLTCCIKPAETLLIRTATEAGLRRGELCGLQRGDINTTACTITVIRQGDRNTTKTGKTRVVSITPDLATLYAAYIADMTAQGRKTRDCYIWHGRGKRHESQQLNVPYERHSMWRVFNRILIRAKLNGITSPHGLRATGATLASQAGVPLAIIRQQLGHSNERMTEDHYIGDAEVGVLAGYGVAFE